VITILSVCLYIPHQLLNGWTILYEAWHVYHGTWAHLNCVLHKSLPSVCDSMCILLSLLGNGSVKTLSRQRIHMQQQKNCCASFSMRSVSYQRKVGDYCFPELLYILNIRYLWCIICIHFRVSYYPTLHILYGIKGRWCHKYILVLPNNFWKNWRIRIILILTWC
jgi:hypothetical protein